MTPIPIRLAILGLAFYAKYAASLSVTPGSACEDVCAIRDGADDGSAAVTSESDIVCHDDEYSTTEGGRRFKACINCLKDSDHTNGSDSDLSALLFNFRLAVETCLFDDDRGETGKASDITGCLAKDACLPLDDAVAFDDFEPYPEDMYGYCTADKKSFLRKHTQSCLTCLHSGDEHVFLSNFLTVLTGGCAYKPEAGSTIQFTGNLFSHDEILIQAPSQDDGETKPDAPKDKGSSGLSREFTVGIVVGISLLFAIAIALFFVYYLRFRKRETYRDPDLFPAHHRSLRHQPSIDADPAPFNTVTQPSGLYPWTSDSDRESVGEVSADYFDYVNATAMAQRPEAEGRELPAHAAYKPYIRSRNHFLGVEGDGVTVTTGGAEGESTWEK